MATPRQRSKARSGSHNKPSASAKRSMRKKLVRAPEIKGPEILKKNWDKKLTVRQNYAKLGLLADMSVHQSGGLEKNDPYHSKNLERLAAERAEKAGKPKKGMARIIRDEEGNVVEIEEAEEQHTSTPWGKPMVDIEDMDNNDKSFPAKVQKEDGEVVAKLKEMEAAREPVPRYTSEAERTWLHHLVQKYDQDVDAMSKDRKLNPWQKTQGEIRRQIKKAGGFEVLRL